MSDGSRHSYDFGPFRLDVEERQLLKKGVSLQLTPKAFEVLTVLVTRAGHLVEKEELLNLVWKDAFVEEINVARTVHTLRKLLGEDDHDHKFIETVAKRGYRFVAEVQRIDHEENIDQRPANSSDSNVIKSFSAPLPKSRKTESGTHVIVDLAEWRKLEEHTETTPDHAVLNDLETGHISVEPTNAFQACQLAQYHFNQMTPPDMIKSRALLEEALRLDADFAPAHAALAEQWVQEVVVGFQEPAVAYPNARASLARAFELDPSSVEYYTAAGFVGLLSDWDFAGAEQNLRRALEIRPHHAFAHSCLGQVYMFQGQPDMAEPHLRLGAELDPTNLRNQHLITISHFLARRYEDAIATSDKMLAVYPRFMIAAWIRGWALEQTGRAAEAVIEYEKTLREPYGSVVNRWLGYALVLAGDEERAREIADKLDDERREHYTSPTHSAAVYAALGDADRAFEYLEMGFEHRDPWMLWTIADPRFDNLRTDPRFDDLVSRITAKKDLTVAAATSSSTYSTARKFKQTTTVASGIDWRRFATARWVGPAAAIIAVAIIGIVSFKLWPVKSPGAASSFSEKRLTVEGGVTRIAMSQDGHYAAAAQNAALVLFDLETGSERVLVPASKDTRIMAMVFHPAGSEIYYETRPVESSLVTLHKMPLTGGEPTKILEDIYGSLTFSPDGRKFAFLRRYSELNEYAMLVADADGFNINRLASSQLPNRFDGTPIWSPDGSKIVCPAISTEGGFHFTLARVDVATGALQFVPDQRWTGLNTPFWLADSTQMIISGQAENSVTAQVWRVNTDTGATSPITNDSFHYESISGSADGGAIAAVKVRQSSHVWILGDKNAQLTAGFDNKDGASGLAWSPDGSIFYHSRAGGRDAIWRMKPDGSEAAEIVPDTAGGFDVSPDGRLLVFQAKQTADHLGLQVKNLVDGSERQLTQDITAQSPSFFPDGKRVAFSIYDKKLALYEIPISGGQPKMLNDEFRAAIAPVVSPSGRFIAFAFNRTQSGNIQAGIAVFDNESKRVTASHPVKITTGSQYEEPTVQWSPDESEVYFIQLDNSVSNLMRLRLADGSVTNVTNFADSRIFNFAVERNSGRILVARGMVERDAMLLRFSE